MSRLPGGLHAKHALLLALAILAAIPYGWSAAASLGLGGGIQIVNLRGLERSVRALLRLGEVRRSGLAQALLAMRLVLLLGVVGVCLVVLDVEPLPFVIGLSTTVPAVLWHGIEAARAAGRERV